MWICLDCEDDCKNGGGLGLNRKTRTGSRLAGGSKWLGKTRKISVLRDREDGASYDAEGATRAGGGGAKGVTDTKGFEADLTSCTRPEGGQSQKST
jgi:hypothetical protein